MGRTGVVDEDHVLADILFGHCALASRVLPRERGLHRLLFSRGHRSGSEGSQEEGELRGVGHGQAQIAGSSAEAASRLLPETYGTRLRVARGEGDERRVVAEPLGVDGRPVDVDDLDAPRDRGGKEIRGVGARAEHEKKGEGEESAGAHGTGG